MVFYILNLFKFGNDTQLYVNLIRKVYLEEHLFYNKVPLVKPVAAKAQSLPKLRSKQSAGLCMRVRMCVRVHVLYCIVYILIYV